MTHASYDYQRTSTTRRIGRPARQIGFCAAIFIASTSLMARVAPYLHSTRLSAATSDVLQYRLGDAMPIPALDGILNILPPHLGDPRNPEELSPYPCTMSELCLRFNTSPARRDILEGFIKLRAELFALGIVGFQWLGGSFVEDIETQEKRAPKDIDVVTIAVVPGPRAIGKFIRSRRDLFNPVQSKMIYHVDHYLISLGSRGSIVLAEAKYWYALFSHRRDDRWKGMLLTPLKEKSEDDAALISMGTAP